MFFNKSVTFATFIEQVKADAGDILKVLGLDESKFLTVPHKFILENPDDVAIGVTKVKIKDGLSVFKMFDTALIKYIGDGGEVIYILYTTTKDYKVITEFAQTLFDKLGPGVYDSDRDYTFKDSSRIKDLATKNQEEDKSIRNVWLTEKYTVVLQYVVNPLHQFALKITKREPKQIDLASRKGTILDLVSVDLNQILLGDEIDKEVGLLDNGNTNFIDYKFKLNKPVLGIFDLINIRLFGDSRVFNLDTQTHVTFTTSKQIGLRKLLTVCEDVMAIYGSDMNGYLELEIGEVDMLENNEFWSGRRWHLNEVNGLHLPGDSTKDVYWVELSNGVTEDGFKLHIGCYNKLKEYFSVD